ncbi:hypothetical protein BKA64DRAFT_240674 [Cadophora sp. MPI-SDFR-AT-0126]|nr:hypothetical protein BKA64DRAFT_240674 [Leotiomycetes sp. MPI-SDFR-AT-0126]
MPLVALRWVAHPVVLTPCCLWRTLFLDGVQVLIVEVGYRWHNETLEKKVKELEASGLSSSLGRALKRNQELESDIERLRTQMTSRYSTPQQIHSELGDELFNVYPYVAENPTCRNDFIVWGSQISTI